MAFSDDLQGITGFASNPYGVPAAGEWNLVQGSFTNAQGQTCVFFYEKPTKNNPITTIITAFTSLLGGKPPGEDRNSLTAIDQASDSGGRRIAVYEYPYLDGQLLNDLGRKGEKYTFNIKFHGLNYQTRFKEFLNIVANVGGTGTLSHPVRGKVKARYAEHEFIHRHDEWSSVTIRCVFMEDNIGSLASANLKAASPDSFLRKLMTTITQVQAGIQQGLFSAQALLLLPAAVVAAMTLRLNSITDSVSSFMAQLAATFSSSSTLHSIGLQSQNTTGGVPALSSGTTPGTSSNPSSSLPPVYQSGFSTAEKSLINAQLANFVNANQITPQQAVFAANQIRSAISAAIAEIDTNLGNDGFSLILLYVQLAIQIQTTAQNCIAAAQANVTLYTVPNDMSLRMVAFLNGLTVDRQNDIEALNPYLGSVNLVPAGTVLLVPAS